MIRALTHTRLYGGGKTLHTHTHTHTHCNGIHGECQRSVILCLTPLAHLCPAVMQMHCVSSALLACYRLRSKIALVMTRTGDIIPSTIRRTSISACVAVMPASQLQHQQQSISCNPTILRSLLTTLRLGHGSSAVRGAFFLSPNLTLRLSAQQLLNVVSSHSFCLQLNFRRDYCITPILVWFCRPARY